MRNRVTNSVKRAKQTYNKKLIDNRKDDTKAFWRTMKKIIPGNKISGGSKNINIDGVLCSEASDGQKIANSFYNFFASAATRLKRTPGSVSFEKGGVGRKLNGSVPNFKFGLVNESLIVKILLGIKASKASGLDNISPRMLKDAAVVVAKPLTRIVNESLSQGTVPREWKCAKITPLFKKGLSNHMDNYRPISVLPVVPKVLERVAHHQLHSFLSQHKLLNPYRCGFRRNHSTEFAAIAFSDYIRRGMDLGLFTGVLFIDLRKAFDSVDHQILISKLESYGLRDIELDWFRNYLTDRKRLVSLGKEISDPCLITSGVPQGSILGPLLFVPFVNDLPIVLERCQILIYADDTVMYFAANNAREISITITSELAKVNDWLVHNSLFIHQGKTEYVLFGTGSRLANANFSVNIDGKELTRVAEYKYLGVILDESLSWNAHVNYLISKVSKRLGILGRTRRSIRMHTAGIIYRSFILPVLDYCDTVWNCCRCINADNVEKLQRRAARIIMQTNSSDEALAHLRYETLGLRWETHALNLVKKCLNKRCPQFLMDYFSFNRDIVQRKTRQSNHLRFPSIKRQCTKKAFYYHGCEVFNRNL